MRGALLTVMVLALVRPAAAEAPPSPDTQEPLGGYLAELERLRRLPPETASLERLRAVLAEAEDQLARGDARSAASRLFALVESPRYLTWKDTAPYQSAELLLGRALIRGGARLSAERYLMRLLARGPQAAYYVPAHRAMVDIALETRDSARVLALLESVPAHDIPEDSAAERAYLDGRVHYETNDLDGAASRFARVGRTSRLYAGAVYFRGLIAARRGDFKGARGAFCEILPGPQGSTLAFNIDGRYFQLQDLARLALGRIAHEQDRYDEAYYFYFSIPEDSDRLAEALFEAAWSMYQKGEPAAAHAFVDAFDRNFPDSPLRPEVTLLRANIALKSCAFDSARAEASALVSGYGPLQKQAAEAATNPERARVLTARLLARPSTLGPTSDDDGRLLALLKLDGRFSTLQTSLREIDADIAEAREAALRWQSLGATVAGGDALAKTASSPEAAQLLDEVEALVPQAADHPALAPRLQKLLIETTLLAHPPRATGPYAQEEAQARELARKLLALRERTLAAAESLATASFRELDERLRSLFRQTRLVHIDAVVGRKKKLEIEIANLRAGRLTGDIYGKLKAEGTLGDDEEYWPFEGELWSDEYENYK